MLYAFLEDMFLQLKLRIMLYRPFLFQAYRFTNTCIIENFNKLPQHISLEIVIISCTCLWQLMQGSGLVLICTSVSLSVNMYTNPSIFLRSFIAFSRILVFISKINVMMICCHAELALWFAVLNISSITKVYLLFLLQ